MTCATIRLGEHLLGFYDGRGPATVSAPIDNWVDDGALSLGICSYAILDGVDAIVYDTHVSVAHARAIRESLEQLGVRRFRVVLSHWHLDHIAGNEVFADCEIIANRTTGALLAEHRGAIEAGTHHGPPAIAPLLLPTTLFDERFRLETANLQIELVQFDIHSRDATVVWLPEPGSCLRATPSRTRSPTSASPTGSRSTLPSWSGCAASARVGFSPTTAAAT